MPRSRTSPSYLNTALGLLAGVAAGVLAFRLLRPLGVSWTVRRLTADMMADLAQLARSGAAVPRFRFESRMYDRINALFTRLDPSDAGQLATMRGSLAALRVGLNTLALHRVIPGLAPELRATAAGVLATLARWFGARAAEDDLAAAVDRCRHGPAAGCGRRARRVGDAGGAERHSHQP